jgi:amidase
MPAMSPQPNPQPSTHDELAALDATAQAALVRAGTVTPAELVDAAIARIERHDPELGAVIMPMFDAARSAARAELPDGPFRGVPILIKDIVAQVAGMPYAAGTRALKTAGLRSPADSYLVAALRRAGFVLVGKTNTSELGILPSAEPPPWPPSRNPYDPTRTTGGSSGGSAAAVAAGLVPVAHANDGGGSIRIPASCCGLFGLKPSRARVSLGPAFGDINGGLVCEHVVARSVRDSAAILDRLAGYRAGDPYAAPAQARRYLDEVGADPGRLRIAFAVDHLDLDGGLKPSHPDCVTAVQDAATLLADLGHHVEEASPDALAEPEWVPRFLTLWAVGVTTDLDEIQRMIGRRIRRDELEPVTYALGELGRLMSGSAYAAAWRWLHGNTRRVAEFFDPTTGPGGYDLWLTPTVTEPPPPLGTFASSWDDPLAAIFRAADFAPFTAPFNATGQPACSVPLSRNAAGLPIGVQLVAAYGREDLLLRVAAQLEAARPFVHAATR